MTDPFFSPPVEKKSDPFTPTLPESFIPRPDPLNRLKTLLSSPTGPHTIVLSSRDGLGGMGKTSLALALMEDATIQATFPDGILWANLGQDPDPLTPMAQWLLTLDDQGLSIPTIAMASDQLRHLIKRRRILLIVDEAHTLEDVEPFQVVEDTDCRLLVTTRDVVVPGGHPFILEEMTVAQAQQFFETQLKQSLEQRNKKDALQFAKAVGYLPLSLNLGVLQVKTGMSWSDLLTGITLEDSTFSTSSGGEAERPRSKRMGVSFSHLQKLWNINRTRENQHQARQRCLKFCLEHLPTELRLRFASLGLFPRNIAITPKMSGMIWGLPIPESRQRLLALKQQGFLSPGTIDAEQGQSYDLHPVMRDIARWLIEVPPDSPMPGLGLTWAGAHQQFLEQYRTLLKEGQWHTIPEDDYIHAHLFWHLEQAGWWGDIHQLLQAFNSEGRNAWYDVCESLNLRSNFMVDLARAWQLAKRVYPEAPEHSTGLQVRYALMTSFMHQSQSGTIDSRANGAIAHESSVSDTIDSASDRLLEDWAFTKVLLKAARYLPDLASKVIKSTFYPSTLNQSSKEQIIFELLDNLHQESPEMVLELTEHLLSQPAAINALIRLAPQRPIFCLPLLQLVQQVSDNTHLVAGAACLAQIGEHKLQPEIYALLPKIAHPLDRLLILAQLQERLPDLLKPKAQSFRQECLKNLSEHRRGLGKLPLTYGAEFETLDRATEAFLDLHEHRGWAIALCFEQHPSILLDQAFSQAMQSRSEEKRSKTLSFLIPKLTNQQRQVIWDNHDQFSDPECKARILSQLLPFFPEALTPLIELLKLFENAKKLDILLPCLPGPDKLVEEIELTIAALSHQPDRWPFLIEIVPHVTPDLFSGFIDVIQETPFDAAGTCKLLQALKPEQAPISSGILSCVEAIPPVYERATALRQIVPFLPDAVRAEARDIALRIQFPYARVIALQNFIPRFPETAQAAMAALKNCHAESPDDLYESLIPVLPLQEREEAIALIAAIPNEVSRLKRLIRILPYQAELIDDIKALIQANPELRIHCELKQVLNELQHICKADLSEANAKPPQTLALILSMLPLIDWVHSPSIRSSKTAQSRFGQIIEDYLHYNHPEPIEIAPATFSKFLEFFDLIPREERRAEILESLLQSTVMLPEVTSNHWMEWLEKLSRYYPYEFHWVLSSMLPSLMRFSNSNTLNQILQSIRAVREQWNSC